MSNPALASLHVYPLKAVRGHAPAETVVEPWGLAGDRRWMLIDDACRVVTQRSHPGLALVTAQPLPSGGLGLSGPGRDPLTVGVPEAHRTVMARLFGDEVELVLADEEAHAWFSAYLDADVRLVHLARPATARPVDPRYARPGETVALADGFPVLLASLSSLDALNTLIAQGAYAAEGPLPMSRFRPSAVVADAPPWAEDEWRRVTIGEVVFRAARRCGRCVVATTDQLTARRGREPLHTLARHHRFGDQLVFGRHLIPESTGTLRLGDPVTVLA
ncbi:molybdenum cofactor biosysynthesis protein [Streptomyces sulfonofaciens]|uniref:Molybdenum cofactor biosysynthesis protein n=1 Tax=Streptomyces sulfonofaciens TaxID=68272 RepID=A0A919KTZ8_9ACTN|nr:MOSC N-terminal beta barrel domain-containing protein [Streptomyces sulfonofaciens]GHH72402.1 molybdenum cofactor biosysynthesis protein [Streptomyces sulfonofaciens]